MGSEEQYIDRPCPCERPGWCPHYDIVLTGRLWEISRMEDDLGRRYRAMWASRPKDGVRPRPPASTRQGGCNCGQGKAVTH